MGKHRNKKLPSIAIVVCYFGPLPWYFDYFLHSCSYNPTVDFIIVTNDQKYSKRLPKNVSLIYKSLHDIVNLASRKLGFQVVITYPYKLCDFKPSYGLIFEDELSGYDFWGHADIDIIFGNIREFLTPQLLSNYEIISVRPDWLTGCFLIFKNEQKLTTLFTKSLHYKKVFTDDRYFNFDEAGFAQNEFGEFKHYTVIPSEIESMTHLVKRLEEQGYLRSYFDLFIIEGVPGGLRWSNGRLFFKEKFEVLLYHLIYFKKISANRKRHAPIPSSFTIGLKRIYHKILRN